MEPQTELDELNWIQQLKPPHHPAWRITHTDTTFHTIGLPNNGWPNIAIDHYPSPIAKDILTQIVHQLLLSAPDSNESTRAMNDLNITVVGNHARSSPSTLTPVKFIPGQPHAQVQLPGWPCSRCINTNSAHQCTCPFFCMKDLCRQPQPGY